MKNVIRDRLRRFFMPHSLRLQLLFRSFFILSVLLLLVGIFQYVLMRHFLYVNKADSMRNQMRSIPYPVWEQIGENWKIVSLPSLFPLYNPASTAAFVDTDGNVYDLFENLDHPPVPRLPAQTYEDVLNQDGKSLNYNIVKDASGESQLVVLQPIGIHGAPLGIVQLSTLVRPLQDVLVRELVTYVSLSLAALIVGLFAFLPTLQRTLIPLSHIVDTVEQINAGNLDERLPTDQGQIEIDRLSTSFNGMLERLESSFTAEKEAKERMRQFIADASHELRTPLTSIHGFLEVLLRGAADNPDQLRKALNSMYGESERLNKLVGDLLFLARVDRAPSFQMKEGRLDLVVHEMESQLLLLAGERRVHFSIAPGATSVFDEDRIKQVILNLFHNAVQHTDPKEGEIHLSLQLASDGIILSLQDNGFGIPEEHLPHLFERFYRIDSSRARKNGGSGLGLAITKSIIDIHGGSIRVESKQGSGTIFNVWLPSVKSDPDSDTGDDIA
ncbi:sensor histidine kinase [Aneurinibacillus terranovensis]|uniref:sensor histidine kinase n=1 Tax=Aneurinibacillus terranovensis TaxID=278991 RepID=UPI000556606E|nr:HAMP domain-containing sensor histidine kinase [Aneurinibacillus terranovensis]